MRITTLIFGALFIFLTSCGQTSKNTKKAFDFYSLVNKQIAFGRQAQQNFIDKLTSSLLAVKNNKNAVIDTKELESLFRVAKTKNIERQSNLDKIAEFDNDINYKGVTMEYFKSYNTFYEDEIPKAISIFGEKSEDRFEKIGNLLMPKLTITKQKELALKQAQKEFEAKYEETVKSNSIRTNGDYEYIKLKDFPYKLTDIKDGTEIELMSFSGGDVKNEKNKIYYKQFIGINKSNGDTVRILALAAMQDYDFEKAQRIGTFKNISSRGNEIATSEKEFIIFNKNQAKVENGTYKTAFGLLEFGE